MQNEPGQVSPGSFCIIAVKLRQAPLQTVAVLVALPVAVPLVLTTKVPVAALYVARNHPWVVDVGGADLSHGPRVAIFLVSVPIVVGYVPPVAVVAAL